MPRAGECSSEREWRSRHPPKYAELFGETRTSFELENASHRGEIRAIRNTPCARTPDYNGGALRVPAGHPRIRAGHGACRASRSQPRADLPARPHAGARDARVPILSGAVGLRLGTHDAY